MVAVRIVQRPFPASGARPQKDPFVLFCGSVLRRGLRHYLRGLRGDYLPRAVAASIKVQEPICAADIYRLLHARIFILPGLHHASPGNERGICGEYGDLRINQLPPTTRDSFRFGDVHFV